MIYGSSGRDGSAARIGILLVIELPLVGQPTRAFPVPLSRIAFGWIALAAGMYLSTQQLDLLISFRSATWLRIGQYLPLGFIFVPATTAAYIEVLEKDKSNSCRRIGELHEEYGEQCRERRL